MTNVDYKYQAFISYNSFDRTVALKLHKALEKYRLPNAGITSNRKTLFPIFIDKKEMLPGGVLTTELTEYLKKSKFLIIICTKSSATADHVAKEIEYFKTLPQGKNIIPVVLDDPGNLDESFFPKPLGISRDDQYLALNLSDKEKFSGNLSRLSIAKLVAKITGLDLTILWSRERRSKTLKIASLSFATVVMVFSIFLYWDLNYREFEEGYKNYYRGPSGWVGVDKVENQTSNILVFKRKGRFGKVYKVRSKVFNGDCAHELPIFKIDIHSIALTNLNQESSIENRFCYADLKYSANGRISSEKIYIGLWDPKTKSIQKKYSEEFIYPSKECNSADFDQLGFSECSGIYHGILMDLRIAIAFTAGKLARVKARPFNQNSLVVNTKLLNHELRLDYLSDSNRLGKISYKNRVGTDVATAEFDYDGLGQFAEVRLNSLGKNNFFNKNYDHYSVSYDEKGRISENKKYRSGQLVGDEKSLRNLLDSTTEKHISYFIKYSYPKEKYYEESFFQVAGAPTLVNGVGRFAHQMTENGAERFALDIYGKPTQDADGIYSLKTIANSDSGVIKLRYEWKDLDGKSVGLTDEDVHSFEFLEFLGQGLSGGLPNINLAKGSELGAVKYDKNGRAIVSESGIAKIATVVDTKGRIQAMQLLDGNQELVENELGIASSVIALGNSESDSIQCRDSNSNLVKLYASKLVNPIQWQEIACVSSRLGEYQVLNSRTYDKDRPDLLIKEYYGAGASYEALRIDKIIEFDHVSNSTLLIKTLDLTMLENQGEKNVETWVRLINGLTSETNYVDYLSKESVNLKNGVSKIIYSHSNDFNGQKYSEKYIDDSGNPVEIGPFRASKVSTRFNLESLPVQRSFFGASNLARAKLNLNFNYLDNDSFTLSAHDDQNNSIPFPSERSVYAIRYSGRDELGFYGTKHYLDANGNMVSTSKGLFLEQIKFLKDKKFFILTQEDKNGRLLFTSNHPVPPADIAW